MMRMLRAKATRRVEGRPWLPSHYPYKQVTVEPLDDDSRHPPPYDNRLIRFLPLLGKLVVGLALAAPVIFLLTWNHLFAIDVGAVTVESDDGSPTQKTFTVR